MASTANGQEGGAGLDPIHQFEINRIIDIELGGIDASFTNSSLWMVISVLCVSALLLLSSKKIVPDRLQSIGELLYEFISNMVRDTVGEDGRKFFPFIFTLFVFILSCNMLGMLPGAFTVTSHIIVTAALAGFVFCGVLIIGFAKNGVGFLKLFVPSGVPAWVLPVVVMIEVISFFSRPLSHSVRLFANMLAGHITLKVFGGFITMLLSAGAFSVLAPLPLIGAVALTALEFLVAFLQAYVFTMLTCMYLSDALHPGH